MQLCAVNFISLQRYSTCFGCFPHPSSGVHKTVSTASGTGHTSVQLPSSNVAEFELQSNAASCWIIIIQNCDARNHKIKWPYWVLHWFQLQSLIAHV